MKKILLVCSTILPGAETAHAEELGDVGSVTVGGTFLALATKTDVGPATSMRQFVVAPSVDGFVADDVSLGISPTFTASRVTTEATTGTTTTTMRGYGAALRLGRLVRLNERVSFWPRISAHYHRTYGIETYVMPDASTETPEIAGRAMGVRVEVPVVLELSRHLYASFSFGSAGVDWTEHEGLHTWQAATAFNGMFGVGFGGWF